MSDWLQGAIQHYDGLAQQIDGDLLNLENFIREHDLVIDFPWGGEFRLSGVVAILREAFELLFFQFPDPDLLRRQAHNLADLHGEGQAILKDFYASLLDLPKVWQGPSAEAYLGPQLGPMSDTQMEAYDQAHKDDPQPEGWHLHANLTSMLAALDHNAQSHHNLAHTFAQVHDAQNEMRFVVPVAVASAVMTPETPPPGDVAEAGIAAGGAAKAGQLMWRLKQLLPVFAVLAILATGVAIYYLVKSGISPSPRPFPPAQPRTEPCPPNVVPQLNPDQQKLLDKLMAMYPNVSEKDLKQLILRNMSESDISNLLHQLTRRFGLDNLSKTLYLFTSGLTFAQIEAFINAGLIPPYRIRNDKVRSLVEKLWDAIRNHLTPLDLEGAWRDDHGCGIPNPAKPGTDYQHLKEVTDAWNSLRNFIDEAKNMLDPNNPDSAKLTPDEVRLLRQLLSAVSKSADYIEKVVTASSWNPGTGLPFLSTLLSFLSSADVPSPAASVVA